MTIFRSEISVVGKLVSGRIKNGRFYMDAINTSKNLHPSARLTLFTKEQLETTIGELETIKNKL